MAIRPITFDETERLGIDDATNKLYWDGREVVTEMSLPWWVHTSAIITAGSTLIIAVATVALLFK